MNKNKYLNFSSVRRKLLIGGASLPALVWTSVARAQAKPPVVIGWLNNTSRKANIHYLVAFKEGMAAFGWKEGANYLLEERWAESAEEMLQPLALELAAKKPAVILVATTQAVVVASKSMPTIPIVQGDGASPVTYGLAASLARPGGMVTGVTNIIEDFSVKLLEFLLEVVPSVKRIGFLTDSGTQVTAPLVKAAQTVLEQRRIQGFFAGAAKPAELEQALVQLAKESVQALVLLPARFFVAERERIIKIAMANRSPVSCGPHEFTEAGALLSYGPDRAALYRRSAYFVDRILKGTKPADLPIEQPTKFELVVNMKTAKALGITMPPSVMVRADKVIE